ncbi:HAD-IIB family hydrolase [Lactonifactor longoviformis]|uniref:HAD-IIB family hydrolase n=1 Tax=Lactonifactor longoviformis TaxID=341220 RepID=UPI001D01C105|nr:HAD-IIB family hydrolase [Lactonifactor longoviformis]MCB5713852.1 HAD-IIB family hydrolase [Lactonifactor longoviformis]MCB5717874.1 HAD-IIB family hydrolase [Lactonifactor longoviformis]
MKNKTLYVSDLDGTLFNSKKCVSEYTIQILNQCIGKGMRFTVATARMAYGCDYRLSEIRLNTPGILTNGVFLYDFSKKEIVSTECIRRDSAKKAVDAFGKNGLSCFIYVYEGSQISIFYNDKKMEEQTQYYSDRAIESCKNVCLTEDLDVAFNSGEVVYLTYTGEREMLEKVCKELDQIEHLNYSFYLNIYNGLYCLEVFSNTANKKNALLKLKKMMECDQLVVFGDNLNDLPMIEIADYSLAPANALDAVKEKVNYVLDDCDHDGVAKYLAKVWLI